MTTVFDLLLQNRPTHLFPQKISSSKITMGIECKYEVSQTAYIKLVLHALKHRSASVNGLLLGRLLDSSSAAAATVQISDAVPLSHSQISLLPSLELALIQVEEHFSAEGLTIVGYYHANERHDDADLGSAAKRIGTTSSATSPAPPFSCWTILSLRHCRKGREGNL
ncbi:putative ER membrane protein complex subunit 8/9-like protein [Iris pallida]|uniref:ER membrane protein complex subunit 8/9-like protein n=1 Tax=Iris pallida TaxID=29817 RepID=A0AAX6H823_IRIPA|nr:putative ER membrane protein complex subunit 8/9-like protein [Iris pallida]